MPETPKPRRFSDFSKESGQNLEGRKVQISDIFGKEITIRDFRIFPSHIQGAKDCVQMQFEWNGEVCVVFTNSVILQRQLADYRQELPYVATVQKQKQYYTLT